MPRHKDGIRLRILSTGTMETDYTWLVLKPGKIMADRHNKAMARVWGEVPTHAVLIEHPEAGRILWDTGVPRDWEERWAPTGIQEYFPVVDEPGGEGFLDSALAQLELTPEDIDMLVLSHLHIDHAANAQLFDNGKTRVIVSANELEGARSFPGPFQGSYIKSDYMGLPFESVSGDVELAPGVSVIQTPGHSWGTMSLLVELPVDGPKIFTSDAVYMRDSWGPPAVGAAIVWDNVRWLESIEKLRTIVDRTGAEMVFGHDAHQYHHELRLSPEGVYE
jgi:N-acyl homoserine lactone hydrolase